MTLPRISHSKKADILRQPASQNAAIITNASLGAKRFAKSTQALPRTNNNFSLKKLDVRVNTQVSDQLSLSSFNSQTNDIFLALQMLESDFEHHVIVQEQYITRKNEIKQQFCSLDYLTLLGKHYHSLEPYAQKTLEDLYKNFNLASLWAFTCNNIEKSVESAGNDEQKIDQTFRDQTLSLLAKYELANLKTESTALSKRFCSLSYMSLLSKNYGKLTTEMQSLLKAVYANLNLNLNDLLERLHSSETDELDEKDRIELAKNYQKLDSKAQNKTAQKYYQDGYQFVFIARDSGNLSEPSCSIKRCPKDLADFCAEMKGFLLDEVLDKDSLVTKSSWDKITATRERLINYVYVLHDFQTTIVDKKFVEEVLQIYRICNLNVTSANGYITVTDSNSGEILSKSSLNRNYHAFINHQAALFKEQGLLDPEQIMDDLMQEFGTADIVKSFLPQAFTNFDTFVSLINIIFMFLFRSSALDDKLKFKAKQDLLLNLIDMCRYRSVGFDTPVFINEFILKLIKENEDLLDAPIIIQSLYDMFEYNKDSQNEELTNLINNFLTRDLRKDFKENSEAPAAVEFEKPDAQKETKQSENEPTVKESENPSDELVVVKALESLAQAVINVTKFIEEREAIPQETIQKG